MVGAFAPPAASNFSCSYFASFTGTAKPTPLLPPDAVAIAVLIPMTLFDASMSGPPELPGLIAASVWMRPVSVRFVIFSWRFKPLIMPEVTEA